MKHNSFLEDEIKREELAVCSSLASCETDNFAELVSLGGFNPATDFAHADLRDCDFSNSDLRGFNFSGADLRGVFGQNIRWDKTTNFTGADVLGSAFEFDVSQRSFFDRHPEWNKTVKSLANWDSISVELWLGGSTRLSDESATEARVALEFYNTTDDGYIKSIILRYSVENFSDLTAYREFLLAELAKPNQPPVLTTCLNVMGRLFSDQPQGNIACQALLSHEEATVRRAALAAAMNGIIGVDVPPAVRAYIRREPSSEIRRYYLGRVARRLTPTHLMAAAERLPAVFRDFRARIANKDFERLADICIGAEEIQHATLTADEKLLVDSVGNNRAERETKRTKLLRQRKLRQLFDDFAPAGITFEVEPVANEKEHKSLQ